MSFKKNLQFYNFTEDEIKQFDGFMSRLKPPKEQFKKFYEDSEESIMGEGGFMFYEALCAMFNSIGIYE
jgi:hypothetical protein